MKIRGRYPFFCLFFYCDSKGNILFLFVFSRPGLLRLLISDPFSALEFVFLMISFYLFILAALVFLLAYMSMRRSQIPCHWN